MPARIVVFGATGYTGRLTSERLVAQGERPVLAGRSEERLTELAERLGGLEWRVADVDRPNTVFSLVERGDVVVSTVGPFAKWGDPAVRAAIAAPAVYLDSTGEPQFIRRVFEGFGPAAAGAGATLMTAMGYDFVPGALAGALALEDAGERRRARGRRVLRAGRRPGLALPRHAGLARRRRAGRRLRLPRRRAADRAPGRAGARLQGPRQAPAGDLGRRRRALRAAGGLPAARGGQRLSRLARAAGAGGAGRLAGRLGRGEDPGRRRSGPGGRRAADGEGGPARRRARRPAGCPGSPRAPTTRPAESWPRSTCRATTRTPSPPAASPGPRGERRTRGSRRPAPWGRWRRSGSRRCSPAARRRGCGASPGRRERGGDGAALGGGRALGTAGL